MVKRNVHVLPRSNGWAVKKDGAKRATSVHPTQQEAEQVGRRIAISEGSELRIHGRDGRVRDSDSFGNDPSPPRDEKR